MVGVLSSGCGGGSPTPTAPSVPLPAAPAAPPATLATAPNQAPAISGDPVCISPLGVDHTFELTLTDEDGDAVQWTAQADQPSGTLVPARGGPVAAGSKVILVYSPPAGPDENWITFTATDARGATATLRLYVKNR